MAMGVLVKVYNTSSNSRATKEFPNILSVWYIDVWSLAIYLKGNWNTNMIVILKHKEDLFASNVTTQQDPCIIYFHPIYKDPYAFAPTI